MNKLLSTFVLSGLLACQPPNEGGAPAGSNQVSTTDDRAHVGNSFEKKRGVMTDSSSMRESKINEQSVIPPTPISGSYLSCTPMIPPVSSSDDESSLACVIRDRISQAKVNLEHDQDPVWSYVDANPSPIVIEDEEMPETAPYHYRLRLKNEATSLDPARLDRVQISLRLNVYVLQLKGLGNLSHTSHTITSPAGGPHHGTTKLLHP